MKFKDPLLAIIIVSIAFFACNNTQTKQKNAVIKTDDPGNVVNEINKTNYEMLQGKWQSEDDKTNFLVFEKNQRKEIAEGMDAWDEEEFVLSDHCENESGHSDNSDKEKDSYISCKESDLCWVYHVFK